MTGIERAAVIQRARPPVDLPTRSRMSAVRRVELTLLTQSSRSPWRSYRSEADAGQRASASYRVMSLPKFKRSTSA